MSNSEMIGEWFSLAKQLREDCVRILDDNKVETAETLEESPKFFAALLFCRTITNFRAVIVLLEKRLIIEAQTLMRSCFENSLWLQRLAKEGAAFCKEISDDGHFNEARFAELVRPKTVSDDELDQFLKERIAAGKGKKRIALKGTDVADGAETEYAMFRQISISAAHPSSTSLLRHVVNTESANPVLSVEVEATDRDVMEVLYFSIAAMMGCLDSFTQCSPFQEAESLLREMAKRVLVLNDIYETTAFVAGD